MHKDKTHLELKENFNPLPLTSPKLRLQFSVTFLCCLGSQTFQFSMKKFSLIRMLHNSNQGREEGKYVVKVCCRTVLGSFHKLFHLILVSPLSKCWFTVYTTNFSTALCLDSKVYIPVAFYLHVYLGIWLCFPSVCVCV